MGTLLFTLGGLLVGVLLDACYRRRPRCEDCRRQLRVPTHCDGCLAVWDGMLKAESIHGTKVAS